MTGSKLWVRPRLAVALGLVLVASCGDRMTQPLLPHDAALSSSDVSDGVTIQYEAEQDGRVQTVWRTVPKGTYALQRDSSGVLKGLAIGAHRDMRSTRFKAGFWRTRVVVDSAGNRSHVKFLRSVDGGPVTRMEVVTNGRVIAATSMDWARDETGFVLQGVSTEQYSGNAVVFRSTSSAGHVVPGADKWHGSSHGGHLVSEMRAKRNGAALGLASVQDLCTPPMKCKRLGHPKKLLPIASADNMADLFQGETLPGNVTAQQLCSGIKCFKELRRFLQAAAIMSVFNMGVIGGLLATLASGGTLAEGEVALLAAWATALDVYLDRSAEYWNCMAAHP